MTGADPFASHGPIGSEATFAGLDGCRSGWVLALLGSPEATPGPAADGNTRWSAMVLESDSGRRASGGTRRSSHPGSTATPVRLRLEWHRTLAGAVTAAAAIGACGIGIDMPVGLPSDGHRPADDAARALLGPRHSTLFRTPARAVLDAPDFSAALARSRAATGKGISIQAWNLMPKIREVDSWVTPGHVDRVFEVHPELAFGRLAGGGVPPEPKRSPAGGARRLALIDQRLGLGAAGLSQLRNRRPGPGVGLDDLVDAIAVACSCERLLSGRGSMLGGGERDERGLTMRVCY